MQTETTDELLSDPGDFSDEDAMEQAAEIAEHVATLGGRDTLRLAAIMATLADRRLDLAADGSVAREDQVLAIKLLVDAEPSEEIVLAGALVRTIIQDEAAISVASTAIATALRAVGGDVAAMDAYEQAQEPPAHRAVCMADGCPASVTYRSTASGAGFFVLERGGMDGEASLGVGPNGRPICPNGESHGEMTLADETLKPAADAFADAQAMLLNVEGGTPVQRALPGVFPVFNFEGAFKEIVQQARRVETLKSDYDDAKQEASDAKKSLDKAAELLMSMTLEFERRRREKAAEPSTEAPVASPAGAPPVAPCLFEQQIPDARCPFCRGEFSTAVLEAHGFHAEAIPPADAVAHVERAQAFLVSRASEEAQQALEAVDIYVDAATIQQWTGDERQAVKRWADALFDQRNEVPDTVVPDRPAVLGRPHVPAAAPAGERQVCSICEVVLARGTEDNPHYQVTDFVDTDCSGKPPAEQAPEHHYPTKRKKAAKTRGGKKGQ